jgi:hypothetical protein
LTAGDEIPGAPEPAAAFHLHPRAVPARHAFAWYEEAMRLWKRAPAMWTLLALITLVVELALERLPGLGALVGKLVTPLVGAGMVVAALAVDHGGRPRLAHAFAALVAPANAIAAIIVASAATLCGEAAAGWWIAGVNLLAQDTDYTALSFATISGISAVGVLASLPFTFVPFHVLLERTGARAAFGASFGAFAINALPLIVYAGASLVLLGFGIVTSGLGLLIALPLWVTSSYAAWKDVFGVPAESAPIA